MLAVPGRKAFSQSEEHARTCLWSSDENPEKYIGSEEGEEEGRKRGGRRKEESKVEPLYSCKTGKYFLD